MIGTSDQTKVIWKPTDANKLKMKWKPKWNQWKTKWKPTDAAIQKWCDFLPLNEQFVRVV